VTAKIDDQTLASKMKERAVSPHSHEMPCGADEYATGQIRASQQCTQIENKMNHTDFLDFVVLAERLHRQFLETISLDLDKLGKRDINDVRALILLNIGDEEMTAGDLLHRGCYVGSNASYNLGKLTEAGYIIQTRSQHDRRVIMVRNSEKGLALCAVLQDVNARRLAALSQTNCREEDLQTCRQTLRKVQHVWDRAVDIARFGTFEPGPTARERPINDDVPQPQPRAA
jgi:DNA-binding MarR family transcriptional regulator